MPDPNGRPPVRVRFKYNVDTGEIEEFIVDDLAPDRSEQYHDRVAGAIGGVLGRQPTIEDAGSRQGQQAATTRQEEKKEDSRKKDKDTLEG